MPLTPYVINGTVRKGIKEGYVLVSTTVGSGGGEEVDISVSSGSELAGSQLVTLTHVSSSETLSETTDADGKYIFDLANLPTYTAGDEVTITIDTRTTNTELQQFVHIGANARKTILVDKLGNHYDENYPLITVRAEELNGHPDVVGNVSMSITFAFSAPDSRPATETVTYSDGTAYKRTFSYDSSKRLISRSRWVKV